MTLPDQTLPEKRQAIRRLLNDYNPADAMAAYYAFHHPDHKTQLVTYPAGTDRAIGYVALSRTGIDLFRPLVTLRLPVNDMMASVALFYQALQPGTAVILSAPIQYRPLLEALIDIHAEERLHLFALDQRRFEPIINVLVARSVSSNGLPRFVIRSAASGSSEVVAAAGLNWQSPAFAEISVSTSLRHQRQGWGRSVVAAMVQYLLDSGRQPLYMAAEQNQPSIRLAESVGFVDSGIREVMLQGVVRPRP